MDDESSKVPEEDNIENMEEDKIGERTRTVQIERSRIETESTVVGDLSVLADANVTVYAATTLEQGLIAQVSDEVERAGPSKIGEAPKRGLHEMVVGANSAVKFGDMTPFEAAKRDIQRDDGTTDDNCQASTSVVVKEEEIDDPSNDRIGDALKYESDNDSEEFKPGSDSEWKGSSDEERAYEKGRVRATGKRVTKSKKERDKCTTDDANDDDFEQRIKLLQAERELKKIEAGGDSEIEDDGYHELKSGLRVPNACWNKLYKYQKTGVRWLGELHDQCVGGILADEMGLGKTIQLICFIRALAFSQTPSRGFGFGGLGPVLIICPTTIMHQWLNELRIWFPMCRVALFHSTGSYRGPQSRLISKFSTSRKDGSVLLTSYTTFTLKRGQLSNVNWHYVVLDEGHKIRNPGAQMTMAMKEVRTPHRLILSGSPLQNSLKELWSLMDFVYPGRLGALDSFTDKFAVPITQGGYANATAVQVRTAYKCACVLRDAINAYVLRRMKKDVDMMINLPDKTEQVLFCNITPTQRALYNEYISSRQCARILSGKTDAFVGLISLRKLCNHPDLLTGGPNKHEEYNIAIDEEKDFGATCRSGKMMVLKSLLRLWKQQGQKVLLFSQSRQMLTVLEKFVVMQGYEYLRMDGSTNIAVRQPLVHKFNENEEIFVFLLTTRVGGLGINLTGANRVVIFDPDWNPSTDVQARERAWRIGQTRAVTVYRLLTSGTIEEKIYQRQVFKQFLANRVLVDPKQKRFFKTNDLHELFTLSDEKAIEAKGTETASLFSGTAEEVTRANFFDKHEIERNRTRKESRKKHEKESDSNSDDDVKDIVEQSLSAERIVELKELARRISRSLVSRSAASKEEEDGKKSRNKRRPRKRKHLFEGKYDIPYLKRTSRSKHRDQSNELTNDKEQDDYVLSKLLCSAGVNSALRHDQVVAQEGPDHQIIEDEANSVAQRAAASLCSSRRSRGKAHVAKSKPRFGAKKAIAFRGLSGSEDSDDAPTFSGSALSRSSGARSKTSLLDAVRARKAATFDTSNNTDDQHEQNYPSLSVSEDASSGGPRNRFDRLAEDIRCFLAVRDGRANTDEILHRFKSQVAVQDSNAFRSILKRVCTFHGDTRIWVLRDEYK